MMARESAGGESAGEMKGETVWRWIDGGTEQGWDGVRSLRDEGREIFTDGWREQIGRDSLRGLVYYMVEVVE